MKINLEKLEEKLDQCLSNETTESLTNWLQKKRLKNYNENKSGFFDLPKTDSFIGNCKDHHHNPPTHLYIPQGKGYAHFCSSCGKKTIIIPLQISF